MKNNGFFHFLALAAYLFAAGASAVMTLQRNEDAGSSVGLAVGAGVFFGLIWVHETVSARAQRRTAAAALADLAKSQAAMEKKYPASKPKLTTSGRPWELARDLAAKPMSLAKCG